MKSLQKIIDILEASIKEDWEHILTSGNIIKSWYDKEVDRYRDRVNNWKDWLSEYQTKLVEETWISKLKIKYTNVSWYFIEISKSNIVNIPDYFVHKQTLVNASRYITSELKEFEESLLQSESILAEREYEIFLEIRDVVLSKFWEIKKVGRDVSKLDFVASLWSVAYKNNYVKPNLHTWYELKIEEGRHPVIENIEKSFISNNLSLSKKDYIHIITGPNMWWKSTFLRQNALIILMAHMWWFIPASYAKIPLTDKVFSRVGATDNLYLWQSTFMVEMQEIANILHNSSDRSFVIIDEIWRWTSTYDGMSLAWSILKHNHDNIKSKTLFATHYHELIDESKLLSAVSNYSVAVWENEENLVFLRKIIPGWMKKSYGIQVAKIAWLNNEVISEAKKMLMKLESDSVQMSLLPDTLNQYEKKHETYKSNENDIVNNIKNTDIDNLTPRQALALLADFQEKL